MARPLGHQVQGLASDMATRAQAKHLVLHLRMLVDADASWQYVFADAARLKQVLGNVCARWRPVGRAPSPADLPVAWRARSPHCARSPPPPPYARSLTRSLPS